jgi:hypothetical protein
MRGRHWLATIAVVASALALAVAAVGATPKVGSFQKRASSPNPVNNVVVDPRTNLIYAEQVDSNNFFRYDPATNKWKKLGRAPIENTNNGGGAYLNGKLYLAYSGNSHKLGVYDIATGKWTTIANPLGMQTGEITAVGHLLYLASTPCCYYGTPEFVSYNPSTHTMQTLATPSVDLTPWGVLAPYKGKIYAAQGDGDTGFGAYNIKTNTWTTLPSVPDGAVLGGAIDPVSGTFYTYGNYNGHHFYRYDIAKGKWLSSLKFPNPHLDDGGMAYVSAKGIQGIYATYGQGNTGFTRYVTPPRHH